MGQNPQKPQKLVPAKNSFLKLDEVLEDYLILFRDCFHICFSKIMGLMLNLPKVCGVSRLNDTNRKSCINFRIYRLYSEKILPKCVQVWWRQHSALLKNIFANIHVYSGSFGKKIWKKDVSNRVMIPSLFCISKTTFQIIAKCLNELMSILYNKIIREADLFRLL